MQDNRKIYFYKNQNYVYKPPKQYCKNYDTEGKKKAWPIFKNQHTALKFTNVTEDPERALAQPPSENRRILDILGKSNHVAFSRSQRCNFKAVASRAEKFFPARLRNESRKKKSSVSPPPFHNSTSMHLFVISSLHCNRCIAELKRINSRLMDNPEMKDRGFTVVDLEAD